MHKVLPPPVVDTTFDDSPTQSPSVCIGNLPRCVSDGDWSWSSKSPYHSSLASALTPSGTSSPTTTSLLSVENSSKLLPPPLPRHRPLPTYKYVLKVKQNHSLSLVQQTTSLTGTPPLFHSKRSPQPPGRRFTLGLTFTSPATTTLLPRPPFCLLLRPALHRRSNYHPPFPQGQTTEDKTVVSLASLQNTLTCSPFFRTTSELLALFPYLTEWDLGPFVGLLSSPRATGSFLDRRRRRKWKDRARTPTRRPKSNPTPHTRMSDPSIGFVENIGTREVVVVESVRTGRMKVVSSVVHDVPVSPRQTHPQYQKRNTYLR